MPKQASAMKKRTVRGSRSGRPIMALLDLLGRRWTLRILWELREQALIATVDALHASATLNEAQFKVLSAHYDDAKIFEIILLCGFYRTVSYLANGLDLPLEATAARFPS